MNIIKKNKEKLRKEARERYKIFLKNKKKKGEKRLDADIKIFLRKKKKKKVEYIINYYLLRKK